MADKFKLGRNGKGITKTIGHGHCGTCGACFINGLTAEIHRCPDKIDVGILKVFIMDRDRIPARSTFSAFNGGGDRENGFIDNILGRGKRV